MRWSDWTVPIYDLQFLTLFGQSVASELWAPSSKPVPHEQCTRFIPLPSGP
jgi:hypothetical protein